MAIYAICGLPGHGKSYSAIEVFIFKALQSGRVLVTNIPLKSELTDQFPDCVIHGIDLSEYAKPENDHFWKELPKSAVFVLDELWRIWPSGLKAHVIPKVQLSFIKEHRHNIDDSGLEPDIVFVTQDLADISSAVRSMVETTIICTKLTSIGAKNNFRRDYYQGSIKGFVGPKSLFIRSEQCRYKPEIFALYKSHTLSTGNDETQVNNAGSLNVSIFNGFGFKLGILFVILLIVVAIWSFKSSLAGFNDMTNSQKKIKTVSADSVVSQSVAPVPSSITPSSSWRLIGIYSLGYGAKVALIADSQNLKRIDYLKYCKFDFDDICLYEGQTIAKWTGSPSPTTISSSVSQ